MGLAGSVLYLSSKYAGETITQMDIAEAAGVTEVTIRNRFGFKSAWNLIRIIDQTFHFHMIIDSSQSIV
jgi:transcription initiation factor TFIIIB Brf1 subunit/transcription initiation factor TFIIB